MENKVIVRLFQSSKFQKNENFFISNDEKITQDRSNIEKIDYADTKFKEEEIRKKKEIENLQNPYSNLSVDEQLQYYLDGRNKWKEPIMEGDIIKIEFNTGISSPKDKLSHIDSILILHKVPK